MRFWLNCLLFLAAAATVLAALDDGREKIQGRSEITAIWLTQTGARQVVVSWVTNRKGPSVVEIAADTDTSIRTWTGNAGTLHHVTVPVDSPPGTVYRYRVRSGEATSPWHEFRWYDRAEVRVAVVANWHTRPPLDGLIHDRPHLLVTAGDNVPNLYSRCGIGTPCITPYVELIQRYPELFAGTIFMPALGNHDKQIRPRGPKPPPEPVYDIGARAFRRCFRLPAPGTWWCLDLPGGIARIVALDLHHTYDIGTTWQSCHPFGPDSEQYRWYCQRVEESTAAHLVSVWNERNVRVRTMAGGIWRQPVSRNTVCVSGFGHFGERAIAGDVVFLNTSLRGTGDRYPDPASRFLVSQDNYVLLTFRRHGPDVSLRAQIKSLDGTTLDEFSVARPIPDSR